MCKVPLQGAEVQGEQRENGASSVKTKVSTQHYCIQNSINKSVMVSILFCRNSNRTPKNRINLISSNIINLTLLTFSYIKLSYGFTKLIDLMNLIYGRRRTCFLIYLSMPFYRGGGYIVMTILLI